MCSVIEVQELVNRIKEGSIQDVETEKSRITSYINDFKDKYNNLTELIVVAPMLVEAYNMLK